MWRGVKCSHPGHIPRLGLLPTLHSEKQLHYPAPALPLVISPCIPPLVTDFKICLLYHPSKRLLRSEPARRPRHYLTTRTRDSTPSPHPTAPPESLSQSGLEIRAELPGWVVKDTPGVALPLEHSTVGFCVSQGRAEAMTGLFTCMNPH